ncbi:MAG: glycosyltransferase family 2 protein [Rikenellaceae bacterium]|nr:glycosyltransferase family 2 protein [Rikenellaceae bacterium]
MVIAGWIMFAFAVVRLGVAFFNMVSRPYLPWWEGGRPLSKVSVLIPARNEEENIGILLGGFARWRDEVHQLIVYDDSSSDRTYEVSCGYASNDSKIRVLRGCELPSGWLGKNHACDRLSAAASGDILLFVDADVRLEKGAVSRAVSYMENHSLELLSVFPRQILDNTGSRLCVPLMNWILLSLLPLLAVRLSPRPSLAAANGQFMMFQRERYNRLRPHSRFRGSAVEDIAIIKYYKKQRLPVAVLLGRDDIACRMYSGIRDAVEGFSKNVFDFFGGSPAVSTTFAAVTTAAPVWIFVFNGITAGSIYIVVIISIRIFVSVASKQNALWNIVLALPQQLVLLWINLIALVNKKKKRLIWKGRNIS